MDMKGKHIVLITALSNESQNPFHDIKYLLFLGRKFSVILGIINHLETFWWVDMGWENQIKRDVYF